MGSSRSTEKLRPLGCTVTVNGMGDERGGVLIKLSPQFCLHMQSPL
jgi:hypothetical protein